MITKKILLEYIDDLERALFEVEEKVTALSCRVKKLETKKNIPSCAKKDEPKSKKGPGRPKGSKNKTKK